MSSFNSVSEQKDNSRSTSCLCVCVCLMILVSLSVRLGESTKTRSVTMCTDQTTIQIGSGLHQHYQVVHLSYLKTTLEIRRASLLLRIESCHSYWEDIFWHLDHVTGSNVAFWAFAYWHEEDCSEVHLSCISFKKSNQMNESSVRRCTCKSLRLHAERSFFVLHAWSKSRSRLEWGRRTVCGGSIVIPDIGKPWSVYYSEEWALQSMEMLLVWNHTSFFQGENTKQHSVVC